MTPIETIAMATEKAIIVSAFLFFPIEGQGEDACRLGRKSAFKKGRQEKVQVLGRMQRQRERRGKGITNSVVVKAMSTPFSE